MAKTNPRDHRFQLITDRGLSAGGSSLAVVRAALSAGASWIQFREKDLYAGDFLQEGLVIRDAVISASAIFIVNDRVDMAMAMDAHGVHLGPDDTPIGRARELLGPDKIIGYSIKRPDDITPGVCGIADYLGIGPIFHTTTKEVSNPQWGLEGIRIARSMTDLPLVAIGGIIKDNARDVINSGADAVAVVSAIVSSDNPFQATKEMLESVRP